MDSTGFVNPDYWTVEAVSGDGARILATGNPPGQTSNDTNTVVIELITR